METKGCFIVRINPNDQWDIQCSPKKDISEEDIPENQKKLFLAVEETSSIIKTLTKTTDSTKKGYLDKLLTLAQVGLVADNPLTELAQDALKSLKEDICIQEGGRIKNEYMNTLGFWALGFIVIAIFIRIGLNSIKVYNLDKYTFVFIGAMIGTWVSFGARKLSLSFNELSIIESDRVKPQLRLLFIGICSCIILLFIDNDIIQIYIGGISSKKINNSVELQLIIGILAGLIEYKIGTGLYNKANEILRM